MSPDPVGPAVTVLLTNNELCFCCQYKVFGSSCIFALYFLVFFLVHLLNRAQRGNLNIHPTLVCGRVSGPVRLVSLGPSPFVVFLQMLSGIFNFLVCLGVLFLFYARSLDFRRPVCPCFGSAKVLFSFINTEM